MENQMGENYGRQWEIYKHVREYKMISNISMHN